MVSLAGFCLQSVAAAKMLSPLALFGLFAVTAMLACYAFEHRSHWFILGSSLACALGSAYGFFQGAWPFGLVEFVWAIVVMCRWRNASQPSGLGESNG